MHSKPHTTCCHICRTSLTIYKRKSIPCSACTKIVCKNCFGTKWKGCTWKEAKQMVRWLCPVCLKNCACSRCEGKSTKVKATFRYVLESPTDSISKDSFGSTIHTSRFQEESLQDSLPSSSSSCSPPPSSPSPYGSRPSSPSTYYKIPNCPSPSFNPTPPTLFPVALTSAIRKTEICMRKPWSFNGFTPNKIKRVSLPKSLLLEQIEELNQRETACNQKIEYIEQLLLQMKKEYDMIVRQKKSIQT